MNNNSTMYLSGQNNSLKGSAYNSALIKAGKCLFAFADKTNDIIQVSDFEGRIIYANQATETMLGYQPDEIMNTPAWEMIHPDDRDIFKNDILSIATDKQLPIRESRLLKLDGSYLDVEIKGFLLDVDENIAIALVIRDISRRKEAEREFKNYRNGLEQLLADSRKEFEKELLSYRNGLEELVQERTQKLEKALVEIKTLKGSIAICMHCNDIRDDDGDWNQIEEYIHDRAEVNLSHGVCPDCVEKHSPNAKTS